MTSPPNLRRRVRSRYRELTAGCLLLALCLAAGFWVAVQHPVPGGPSTEVVGVAR